MKRTVHLLAALALTVTAAGAAGPAPAVFATSTIPDGAFDLSDHRERWVVVNFWATWCKPCREEIPELDALHRERADVTVVGLAFEEAEVSDILAFLRDYPATYPIALVDVFDPPAAFGVPRVLPTTVLLGPGGLEIERFVGPVTREELEAAIAAGGHGPGDGPGDG